MLFIAVFVGPIFCLIAFRSENLSKQVGDALNASGQFRASILHVEMVATIVHSMKSQQSGFVFITLRGSLASPLRIIHCRKVHPPINMSNIFNFAEFH